MEHQGPTGHATARVDEHGNQVAGHGTTTGVHGATGGEQMQPMRDDHKTDGVLHRSGSSSSEDDGMGGRRKKGIKEKITEKLPGGNKDNQQHATATGTEAHGTTADGTGEKKGVMDKIKEKLPGGNKKQDEHQQMGTGTYGQHGHTGMTGTGTGTTGHETGEKKGVMDKIKEKLPGQH